MTAPTISESSLTAALGWTTDVVSSLPPVRNTPLVCSRCIFMCGTANATMSDLAQLTQIFGDRFISCRLDSDVGRGQTYYFSCWLCVWMEAGGGKVSILLRS